jgi:hypothetical protein
MNGDLIGKRTLTLLDRWPSLRYGPIFSQNYEFATHKLRQVRSRCSHFGIGRLGASADPMI